MRPTRTLHKGERVVWKYDHELPPNKQVGPGTIIGFSRKGSGSILQVVFDSQPSRIYEHWNNELTPLE